MSVLCLYVLRGEFAYIHCSCKIGFSAEFTTREVRAYITFHARTRYVEEWEIVLTGLGT
jgi:hypothetical protein